MKTEEIRKVANQINATHLNWTTTRHVGFETERLLIELVAQAYEEAIKATCELCNRDGIPEWSEGSGYEHPGDLYCRAICLRDLRDSLLQVPVS